MSRKTVMNVSAAKNKATNRGEVTRDRMMRAAERLFAIHGIENVSVRAIIVEADQKNESALQYHFGDRAGLIKALQVQRNIEVATKREEMMAEMFKDGHSASLRDICFLMVMPPFQLCRSDSNFRNYIGVFGQLLLSSSRPVVSHLEKQEAESMRDSQKLLRELLSDFDDEVFAIRVENTASFATQAMSKRARDKGTFSGKNADFFINNLVDTMAAMMAAEISGVTQSVR